MVKYDLNSSFTALSDPTRRDILQRLTSQTLTVGEIAESYNMSLPAVSKHIKMLELAGLITKERHGRLQMIRMAPTVLHGITKHLLFYEMQLHNRLDSLENFLEHRPAPVANTAPSPQTDLQKVLLSHEFDVSCDEVWRAYTNAQQIAKWWAPKGTTLIDCQNNARVGGHWRFVVRGRDGQQYTFSGVFREVEKRKRLVYTDGFGDATKPRPESLVTVTFEELPSDRTKITRTTIAPPSVHQLHAVTLASIGGGS